MPALSLPASVAPPQCIGRQAPPARTPAETPEWINAPSRDPI